jgi:hypothetical protein
MSIFCVIEGCYICRTSTIELALTMKRLKLRYYPNEAHRTRFLSTPSGGATIAGTEDITTKLPHDH